MTLAVTLQDAAALAAIAHTSTTTQYFCVKRKPLLQDHPLSTCSRQALGLLNKASIITHISQTFYKFFICILFYSILVYHFTVA